MTYIVNNGGISTLAVAVTTTTQTTITVAAGHGARFPSPTGGDYTLVTLENAAGAIEIVSIVGRSTDTLTVGISGSAVADAAGRGRESTTAATWAAADIVEGRATAAIVARGGNAKTTAELLAAGGAAFIGNTPAGTIAATTVQAALNEIVTDIAAAAGAANVGNTPAGTIAATTVQAALNEIVTDMAAAAGAANVGNTPAGNIAATTVQAALNELDTEKAKLAGDAAQPFSASTFTGALVGNATTANRAANTFFVSQFFPTF